MSHYSLTPRPAGNNRDAARRQAEPSRPGARVWFVALNLGLALLVILWSLAARLLDGVPRSAYSVLFFGAHISFGLVWAYALIAHFRTVAAGVTPALVLANLCALAIWVGPVAQAALLVAGVIEMDFFLAAALLFVEFSAVAIGAGALAKTIVDHSPEESWLEEALACVGYRR